MKRFETLRNGLTYFYERADLQIELVEQVVSEIRSSGGKAKAVEIDVTDFPAVEQLVQETVQRTPHFQRFEKRCMLSSIMKL